MGGSPQRRIPQPTPRYTPGEWRRRSAASSFAIAVFTVCVATAIFSVVTFHRNGSADDLVTAQLGAISGTLAISLLTGMFQPYRSPSFWHGAGLVVLGTLSLVITSHFSTPITSFRNTYETMMTSIAANALFFGTGLAILSGSPLSGTASNPASSNIQMCFALAVALDSAGSATEFLFANENMQVVVDQNDILHGDATIPNSVGMYCGYGGAFLALCSAASHFFLRCVCTSEKGPLAAPILAWAGMTLGPGCGHAARIWLHVFQHGIALDIVGHGVAASAIALTSLYHVVIEIDLYRSEKVRFRASKAATLPSIPEEPEEHAPNVRSKNEASPLLYGTRGVSNRRANHDTFQSEIVGPPPAWDSPPVAAPVNVQPAATANPFGISQRSASWSDTASVVSAPSAPSYTSQQSAEQVPDWMKDSASSSSRAESISCTKCGAQTQAILPFCSVCGHDLRGAINPH